MNLELLLLINRLEFLGFAEKRRVGECFDDAGRIAALSLADLGAVVGRRLETRRWQGGELRRQAGRDAEWLARGQGRLLAHGQADYPAALAEIDEPPFALFCRGQPPEAGRILLAVVGTRRPSEGARLAAWEFARQCANRGLGVVSGLAHGIDGAAHAAVVMCGGYTAAVLAGGIDRVHPRLHRELAGRLLDCGGCLLSEYGPGTETMRYQFPFRNRIISGLCPVTVVIEAPERSGALITAQYGLDQGRDVYVHAAGCAGSQGTGTRNLAASGARIIGSLDDLVRPEP